MKLPRPITWFLTAAAAATILSLSSCNTVSGLGRDIENAGTSLENAAQQ